MGGIFFILLIVGAIIAWIMAGVKAHQKGGSKLFTTYFVNLLLSFATVFLLWLAIVYPSLHCSGFLCGLGEMIMWILTSAVLMLIWPLILLARYKKGMPSKKPRAVSEEIIDVDDEII